MEVKCYLKAKKKKNMKKPFINKNLPALFCLLLLTRQFDKAGVIPFLSISPQGGILINFNSIPLGILLQRVPPRTFKSFVILGAFCC